MFKCDMYDGFCLKVNHFVGIHAQKFLYQNTQIRSDMDSRMDKCIFVLLNKIAQNHVNTKKTITNEKDKHT